MSDLRSSAEWEKRYIDETGCKIWDPDGWDRLNYDESWNELISYSEFRRRAMRSTLMPVEKLKKRKRGE